MQRHRFRAWDLPVASALTTAAVAAALTTTAAAAALTTTAFTTAAIAAAVTTALTTTAVAAAFTTTAFTTAAVAATLSATSFTPTVAVVVIREFSTTITISPLPPRLTFRRTHPRTRELAAHSDRSATHIPRQSKPAQAGLAPTHYSFSRSLGRAHAACASALLAHLAVGGSSAAAEARFGVEMAGTSNWCGAVLGLGFGLGFGLSSNTEKCS